MNIVIINNDQVFYIIFIIIYIIIILWTRQFFLLLIGSILLHDIVRLYEYIYTYMCSLKRRCIIIPALMYRGSSSGVGRRQDEGGLSWHRYRSQIDSLFREAPLPPRVLQRRGHRARLQLSFQLTSGGCDRFAMLVHPLPTLLFPSLSLFLFYRGHLLLFPFKSPFTCFASSSLFLSSPPSPSSSLTRPSHPSSQVCIVRPARARPATADFVEPVPNRFVRASLARSACDGERASSDLTGIRRESTREKSGRALIRGAIRDTWYALTHTRAPWFLTDPGRIPLSSNHPRVNHSRRWWEKSECLANVFHGVSRGTFAGRQNVRY